MEYSKLAARLLGCDLLVFHNFGHGWNFCFDPLCKLLRRHVGGFCSQCHQALFDIRQSRNALHFGMQFIDDGLGCTGTPKPIIDKLHAEMKRIAALPDVKERLVTLGAEPSNMTPEQFAQWVKTEIPAMAKIVKDEKITAE